MLAGALLLLGAFEAYRAVSFYSDLSRARDILVDIREDLDLVSLEYTPAEVLAKQDRLREASDHLDSAAGFAANDPILNLARLLPVVGKQVSGLRTLTFAAEESALSGIKAADVALAFKAYEKPDDATSLQAALEFIASQDESMIQVEAGLGRLKDYRDDLPDGLWGPLGRAATDLGEAVDQLDSLVEGYNRANTLLPEVLGANGKRTYLVLPQNDTELFPSGGLISSYAIVSFEDGKLQDVFVEYSGTLYDRWHAETGDYIEPPQPLKNYLKKNLSWTLGEMGWYPDFPTTAELARDYVHRAGVPDTEGIIALDMKFLVGLLEVLGQIRVPDYDVTVTPDNAIELSLELTRDYVPGEPRKAFLGDLTDALLSELFSAPKEKWVDLLEMLDRMGRERHLQLNFLDPELQQLSYEYGFGGELLETEGDFLLVADTSVNSTKLNLILEPTVELEVRFQPDLSTQSTVKYEIRNPFPEWKEGRDESLVEDMLGGVYGSYTRLYLPETATLKGVWLDGNPAGVEEVTSELGKRVFGRFFRVRPGETANVEFAYDTPRLVKGEGDGSYRYVLYVQKQAGTGATPLEFRAVLPEGAILEAVYLDGDLVETKNEVSTDLLVDRRIDLVFSFE